MEGGGDPAECAEHPAAGGVLRGGHLGSGVPGSEQVRGAVGNGGGLPDGAGRGNGVQESVPEPAEGAERERVRQSEGTSEELPGGGTGVGPDDPAAAGAGLLRSVGVDPMDPAADLAEGAVLAGDGEHAGNHIHLQLLQRAVLGAGEGVHLQLRLRPHRGAGAGDDRRRPARQQLAQELWLGGAALV